MSSSARAVVAEIFRNIHANLAGDRMGGRVARGSLKSMLVNGTGAAASFLVQIFVANLLGIHGYGTYLLVMGWHAIAQLFGKLELDSTAVRFVGSYVATERWKLLLGFLKTSRAVVLMTSSAIAVVCAIGIVLFRDAIAKKDPALPTTLLIACVLLPVVTRLLLEGAVLQGLQRYANAQLPINLFRPLAFGLFFGVATLALGMTATVPLALGANLLSVGVALVIATRWRKEAMPSALVAVEAEYDKATWARTAYPLLAVSFGQVVISQQADVIIIGLMMTTADAAVYGAASQLTMPIILAASSVTYVAQPMIADLYSRDPKRLQSLIRAVTWLGAGVALPIAVLLIAIGPHLLNLYGDGYARGHTVLIILTIAHFVVGLVGSLAGFMLTMTAHERDAARIIITAAVLNVVLALVLTPRFGAVGTASATLMSALARTLALRYYIKREMGLSLPAF